MNTPNRNTHHLNPAANTGKGDVDLEMASGKYE
jgi:hypothetical protein